MMDDIFVRVVRLPLRIRGMCAPGVDGMNIYLNENLNREQQREAFLHEMRHIANNDFEETDVQMVEVRAHRR